MHHGIRTNIMKTFEEIRKLKKIGDYEMVSKIVGCGYYTLVQAVYGRRPDNFRIQQTLSSLITDRELFMSNFKKRHHWSNFRETKRIPPGNKRKEVDKLE